MMYVVHSACQAPSATGTKHQVPLAQHWGPVLPTDSVTE